MTTSAAADVWSRRDLRVRWRSLAILGLLIGLTMGVATATFDGAHRTSTALERLAKRTNASNAVVFGTQIGLWKPDWPKLAKRPEVLAVGRWALLYGNINGAYGGPIFGAVDTVYLGDVDRPIVIRGRMFDPGAADEMVVDEDQVKNIPLGSTVTFKAFSPQDMDSIAGSPSPHGPTVKFRVVGVVRNVPQFVFTNGYAMVSPGFLATYGDRVFTAENANVRLRADADMSTFRSLAGRTLAAGIPVLDARAASRRVRTTTDVETTMLSVLAAVLLLAGAVLLGQALLRSGSTIGIDASTLRAMGFTRRDLLRAGLAPHVLTMIVAVITTVVTAVFASRWFPVGYAAKVDPDRGIRVAPMLVVESVLLLTTLLLIAVTWAAWRSCGSNAPIAVAEAGRLRTWMRKRRPISVNLGVSMATEWRTGRTRTGAAAALLGATVAAAGVVGMINLNRGVDDALAHPQRAGVAWDATISSNAENTGPRGPSQKLVDDVAGQRDVVAVASVLEVPFQIQGPDERSAGVRTFAVIDQPSKERIRFTVVSGRLPSALGEIALGPSTADAIGVSQGDQIRLSDGTTCDVVGIALFPNDIHSAFDEGALLAPNQYFALTNRLTERLEGHNLIAVRLAPGDAQQQLKGLGDVVGDRADSVDAVDIPRELTNLRNIRSLPLLVAAFLAVVGIAAIGHALFSSVRHRNRDFAVLRALGLTRRGAVAVVAAQATSIALVGLVVGIPSGFVTGRIGWQEVTDRVPLRFEAPIALAALAVVIPVAVVVVNALAVIPSRRASRVNPALVLRSE